MGASDVDLHRYLQILQYRKGLLEAEQDLVRFAEVTMPVLGKLSDINATHYRAAPHHRFMGRTMMEVEAGLRRKVILNLPPRHGKTELCTKRAAAWIHGRHPDKDIIIATYNEKFAADFGKEVRAILTSPRFRQIFPNYALKSQSNEHIRTTDGGEIFFLGRRSSTTGRGGDFILVDDPTKDDKEVRYDAFREDCWQWFTQTLLTRRHHDRAPIVLTQTRWHEDDIVGRITDKTNPAYSAKFAAGFEIINLPAIADDNDALGRKPGEALWPERFGLSYLEEMREANSVSFSSLYQCDPAPADGVFYSPSDLHEYQSSELPDHLYTFVVSDHAVGTGQQNDPTVICPYGVDDKGTAWLLPGLVWRRMDSEDAVEEMIRIMRELNPIYWFAEKGQISKSIGPFLRKRMQEEDVYTPFIEEHPVGDKVQRAQSGRARCAQGKIRFPAFAPWWPKARTELLKFPNARHDDFVDVVSMIGLKVGYQHGPGSVQKVNRFERGTFGHMLAEFKRQDREEAEKKAMGAWGARRW